MENPNEPSISGPEPADGTCKQESKSESADPPSKKELSPEEQMALYEESLKETDWGHQPC